SSLCSFSPLSFFCLALIFPYSLLCHVFFSLLSLVLLYLHSFPTRRSSDLRSPQRSTCLTCLRTSSTWAPKLCTVALVMRMHRPRDRKSTRLNSSHVSISYAGFCLKNKIKYNRCSGTDTVLGLRHEVNAPYA